MKKLKFFALPVLLLALAGCGGSDSPSTPGGNDLSQAYSASKDNASYTLVVSPDTAKSVHNAGDSYKLTVVTPNGGKISSGKTAGMQGGALVLQPSFMDAPSFSVTVSGTGIVNISGTITYDNGAREIGPGVFPVGSEGGGNTAFTSIDAAGDYLAAQAGGRNVYTPITLVLRVELSGSGWGYLLNVIDTEGKYVNLDLSGCTVAGTLFNPDHSVSIGKDLIVALILPNSATSIENGDLNNKVPGFNHFANLKTVSGANITTIGQLAFADSAALISASFPKVTTIGYGAFSVCYNLTTINMPAATTIDGYAFEGCTKLALASLPEGLTYIGSHAFYECTSLTLSSLPQRLTYIGESAFYECTGLTLTSLPKGLTYIDNQTFYGCRRLALTSLPSGVTTIGIEAFSSCRNLTLTVFPEVLSSIGGGAFDDCSGLTRIELPGSLISIDASAFIFCTNLTMVTIRATTPPSLGLNALYGTHANLQIRVPSASVNAYVAAAGWSEFVEVIRGM